MRNFRRAEPHAVNTPRRDWLTLAACGFWPLVLVCSIAARLFNW